MLTNVSFPLAVRVAERRGGLVAAVRRVRWVDRWVTIPAYLLTALTGGALVAVKAIPITAPWLVAGTLLWAAAMGVGFVLYRPVSRARLAAAARGASAPAYRAESARAERLDAFILVAVLLAFVLMVLRPG